MKILKVFLCFCLLASTASLFAQGKKTGEEKLTDYKNFDFVPGEKTLFFDDFSKGFAQWDRITWDEWEESDKGSVTTSSVAPGNWFYMPRKGTARPKGLGTLPNQFTLEYDLFIDEKANEHEGGVLNIFVREKGLDISQYSYHFSDVPQIHVDIHPSGDMLDLGVWREEGYTKGINEGRRIFKDLKEGYWKINQVYRVSISRNGSHIKAYINQDKVIDLPNALPPNENYAFLLCSNFNGAGFYVSNVRMATGVPQPAKDLKEKKLYITQNIRFATNSDKIAANSYPTLSQVAQAIKSLEGKIQIVGHTDSDGNADKNLELSQKRAAAVKNALVKEFGIDAARLETDGKGQSKPIDSNDTPQGKANNRRVEFVVLP
jgi:outer membrane protein OmpA-like peptidoglycan-associated protein